MLITYICYDGILDDLGQTQILPYIYGLNDKGYNFIIFSFERYDRKKEEFTAQKKILSKKGILWYHLTFYPRKYNRFLRLIFGPLKLNQIIKKHNVDFAHLRSINAGTIFLLSTINIPYIYDIRAFAGQLGDYGLIKNSWILNFFSYLEKILINNSKAIVVLDDSGADYIKKTFKIKIPLQVIPTSTNIKKFNKKYNKKFIKEDHIKFVLLGGAQFPYLTKKALEFILFLLDNNIKCSLDIINQRHHQFIKKVIQEVNFPEEILKIFPLKPNEVFDKLPSYDCGLVFIETGNWIKMSSPTKIGEYLAAGLHVIGLEGIEVLDRLSKETNRVDVLPRNNNYFNLKTIMQIMQKIKSDKRRQESIAIANKYYDLNIALKKYLTLYQSVVK